ncbi:MAG: hypothetical protein QME05_01290 [Candidatus Margulisbacteria bacterium]|nr:hypothetical protein [Candidatus Margulisiibacteriota bacterium]
MIFVPIIGGLALLGGMALLSGCGSRPIAKTETPGDSTTTLEPVENRVTLLAEPGAAAVPFYSGITIINLDGTLQDLQIKISLDPNALDPSNADAVPGFPPCVHGNYAAPLHLTVDPNLASQTAEVITEALAGSDSRILLGITKVGNDRFEINFTTVEEAAAYNIYVDDALVGSVDVASLDNPTVGDIPFLITAEMAAAAGLSFDSGVRYDVHVAAAASEEDTGDTGEDLEFEKSEAIPVVLHWADSASDFPEIFGQTSLSSNSPALEDELGASYILADWDQMGGAVTYEVCSDNGVLAACELTTNSALTLSRLYPVPYSVSVTAYPGYILDTAGYEADLGSAFDADGNLIDTGYLANLRLANLYYETETGEAVDFDCSNPSSGCVIDVDGSVAESLMVYGEVRVDFPTNLGNESQIRSDLLSPDEMYAVPLLFTFSGNVEEE